jgi:hypothetical protein
MTKWFDTNYHYIVPELSGNFSLRHNRPLENYLKIKQALNIETTPTLIGPFTYITVWVWSGMFHLRTTWIQWCAWSGLCVVALSG